MHPRTLRIAEAAKIAQGLTLSDLAAQTGIHPSTISHILRGRVNATPTEVERLAIALGIPPEVALQPVPINPSAHPAVPEPCGVR